ncbi:type II secretion system F family protein [Kineosporia babensis]|uniref:Type II secretion system F family protein n=1 Tax=Kineosporia babensis TaxID=499548 RepID=A0A9X1SWT0_9ACTN|nr:type II secretion system F family protein [Kineosporia babensis]MCD5309748.1 type II secretion system F family protein [Kineosporia babensis]
MNTTAVTFALSGLLVYLFGLYGWQLLKAPPDVSLLDTGSLPMVGRGPVGARIPLVAGTYRLLGRRTGPAISGMLGPRWRLEVRNLLAAAGQPRNMDVAGFAELQGAYAVLALLGGFTLLIRELPLLALPAALLLLVYPSVWLYSEAQRRQRRIELELPDFLDVLAITVTAGLGFRAAMERVGETLEGPLAEEVRRTMHRMEVGVRRRDAFLELRERNPRSATMGLFVTAMIQAEELGAPLADTLNQLAEDMRREFAQIARRRASRAAPRVSLIITMVIMPAVVALLVLALFLGSDVDLGSL